MPNRITRSTVNEQQYSAAPFGISGFPLSYRRYSSYALGRIHVAGFHWTMPGDKISGLTRGKCTFERMVTPIVSPVNAMQYNIYIPLRPLDRTFKKGITPTKRNNMSSDWTMPLCNTRYIIKQLLTAYYGNSPADYDEDEFNDFYADFVTCLVKASGATGIAPQPNITISSALGSSWITKLYGSDGYGGIIGKPLDVLHPHGYPTTSLTYMADAMYMRDALEDIYESAKAKLGTKDNPLSGSMTVREFCYLYLTALLEPWVGRYSYYAELKYEFVRPWDLFRICNGLWTVFPDEGHMSMSYFVNTAFSDTPQNEYKLRAMYATWYERFRNVDLEPDGGFLPDWQEFGSTSILDCSSPGGNLCYLLWRIRPWEDDMFISAQIDDLSRHVYAPIVNSSSAEVAFHVDNDFNNLDTQDPSSEVGSHGGIPKPAVYTLSYLDQNDGLVKSVACPVPTNINDMLSSLDKSFFEVYGLDLNTLRQSQMLERYLKRNYLFGDEYQDRMLAHYNSRVSDFRVNKPEILSQSMDGYNMGQEIANMSNGISNAGDRTAIGEINVNGEQFTTYCEEFGIVLSLVCFMPRSMYDGSDPINYIGKAVDLPLPEFATNNEEFGRKSEISGTALAPTNDDADNTFIFGRYPAYHAWRSRVDEVGGKFLDEMQDCTFRRFFGMYSANTTPKLNYFFIHCRPNLNMFASNLLYDMQLYGDLVNEFYVERVLPTPVEQI